MNEISAVSPRFCFDHRDLLDLIAEFGPYMGRYIANCPANWKRELLDHLAEIGPLEKSRVAQLLNPYNDGGIDAALLSMNYPYDRDFSWTENIRRLREKHRFDHIIADAYEPDEFGTWQDQLSQFRATRHRSQRLHGKTGEYISIIRPLLTKGPAAFFIDPYFRPIDPPSVQLIQKIFENIANSSCYQINFYVRGIKALSESTKRGFTQQSLSFDEYKYRTIASLSNVVQRHRGKSLTINLVDDAIKSPELHNRFFLTKTGALDFGKGFQKFDYETAQIPVHIVDREVHHMLVEQYIDSKAKFREIDTITIPS